MSTISWDITGFTFERMEEKSSLLMDAIQETVQTLGEQLLERVHGKLSGEVLKYGSGALYNSVMLEAALFVGAVCQTSVGIDEGSPSFLIGKVHEYGGTQWYDIYPHEVLYEAAGLSGQGRISRHSREGFAPFEEGRLPHVLAWTGADGGTVFAKHVWHPPAEERSFLRSSLADMQSEINERLRNAVAGVLAS